MRLCLNSVRCLFSISPVNSRAHPRPIGKKCDNACYKVTWFLNNVGRAQERLDEKAHNNNTVNGCRRGSKPGLLGLGSTRRDRKRKGGQAS